MLFGIHYRYNLDSSDFHSYAVSGSSWSTICSLSICDVDTIFDCSFNDGVVIICIDVAKSRSISALGSLKSLMALQVQAQRAAGAENMG